MANKKARILHNQTIGEVDYKCNQVIEADAALVDELVKQGGLDDSPESVKYCIENEGAEPILHKSPASKAEAERLAVEEAAKAEAEQAARQVGEEAYQAAITGGASAKKAEAARVRAIADFLA